MLYIADLKRDGLLKIGVAGWYRTDLRESELRRQWNAPKLRIISSSFVPSGWGGEIEWERRLISRLKHNGVLQLFASGEGGREIVDCTREQALDELGSMQHETRIDHTKDADELSDNKEDSRFCNEFLQYKYPECDSWNHHHYWKNVVTRQVFINWLRGDERAPIPERILNR